MNRRDFPRTSTGLLGLACGRPLRVGDDSRGQVMPVRGPVAPEKLGVTPAHEHVLAEPALDRRARGGHDLPGGVVDGSPLPAWRGYNNPMPEADEVGR